MRRTIFSPLLRSRPRPIPTFRSRPFEPVPSCRTLISAAEVQFGQPIHETHPHLIVPGDLSPGISALEYHHRRAALASRLPRNSLAILASADLKYRSGAVFYEFHQDSNFFYLTGFNEPEALAVIERGEGERDVEYTFWLFVRGKDERAEKWDGARSGVQAARDVWNADEAMDIEQLSSMLPPLVNGRQVYTDIGEREKGHGALGRFIKGRPKVEGIAQVLKDGNATVKALRPLLNDLRVYKSEAELACMRKAGSVSGRVLTEAMKSTPKTEKQLWADLAYGYRSNGLDGEAYVPVIAGGQNALSIHYVRNDSLLQSGETVLVDAGGEYGSYITDITRTWPIDGKFTDPQRDLYSMILNVQKSCVSLCREDADVTLDKIHAICENGLRDGLRSLGFNVKGNAMDVLFPHHVGHHIGLDVHDAPGYPRTERLRKNHCITIEPGIYVPDSDRWPAHFRGLGIRIEDSVVIGEDRPELLTRTAVKDVDEIEGLR